MAMIFIQPGKTGIDIKADKSACLKNDNNCHGSRKGVFMKLNKLRPMNGHLNKAVLMFAFGSILADSQAMKQKFPVKMFTAQEFVNKRPTILELNDRHGFKFKNIKDNEVFKDGKVFHTHGICINKNCGLFSFPDNSPMDDVYTLPEGYKRISTRAFSFFWGKPNYCIRNVIIPEGYMSIGTEAFYGCYNLEKIQLPKSLLGIGAMAFADTKITEFTFPRNIIYIGNHVFSGSPIKAINATSDFKFHFCQDVWTGAIHEIKTAVFLEIEEGNASFLGAFPESRKLKITKPVACEVNGKTVYKMETVTIGKALWNKVW